MEGESGLNKISLVWITRDASFYAQLLFHASLLWQGGRGMCRKSHFVLQLLSTLLLSSSPPLPCTSSRRRTTYETKIEQIFCGVPEAGTLKLDAISQKYELNKLP